MWSLGIIAMELILGHTVLDISGQFGDEGRSTCLTAMAEFGIPDFLSAENQSSLHERIVSRKIVKRNIAQKVRSSLEKLYHSDYDCKKNNYDNNRKQVCDKMMDIIFDMISFEPQKRSSAQGIVQKLTNVLKASLGLLPL